MARLRMLLMLTLVSLSGITAVAQEAPQLIGAIALIGSDNNVYVVGADLEPTALTTDAHERRRYQFPTWSTDGRLAFFCCDSTFAPDLSFEAYVATPDLTAAKMLYEAANEGYTYAYWSPANCDAGPACRDLAVLLTRAGDAFKVEIIRQNGTDISSRMVGSGAPFYFSWHSDGKQMLWYRNNREILYFDADANQPGVTMEERPGAFQAPAWSPVDDRAAFVVLDDDSRTSSIVIVDGPDREVIVAGMPTSVRGAGNVTAFGWSPDGRYLAYRAINRFGASPVFVVDSQTGEPVAVTADANVAAFFWSPDSRRLAYLTLNEGADSAGIARTRVEYQNIGLFRWSTLEVSSNVSQALASFTPTAAMYNVFSFFDQFSQSHQLWSPDSRYLVYGDAAGGRPLVKVLDTSDASLVPFTLAEGHIGIWSYHE